MNVPRAASLGLAVVSLLVAACGASSPPPGSADPSPVGSATQGPVESSAASPSGLSRTQAAEAAGVTVEGTWNGPDSPDTFNLVLDTHSVDLDGLDLADSTLRNDRGEEVSGATWDAPKGGHHREGELRFEDADALVLDAAWIELVIRNVADVPERVLRWEMGS